MTLLQQYQEKKRWALLLDPHQRAAAVSHERQGLLDWMMLDPTRPVACGLLSENVEYMMAEGFVVTEVAPSYYIISIPDEE